MPEREGALQPENGELPKEEQWLPRISRKTKEAMLSDLMQSARRREMSQRVQAVEDTLRRENPVLLEVLNEMAALSRDSSTAKNTGLYIIDLLRRQAQADRMKKQFGETAEE